jgi:hypothetical protein
MTELPHMNQKNQLLSGKILVAFLAAWMSYVVISTSLQSNLFKEWHELGAIPWMRATLWDFYTNTLVIYLWICYKERSLAQRIIWLILLVTLGSIATCAYVFIKLFRLSPDEGWKELFTKQSS